MRKRILVVDDQAVNRMILKKLLGGEYDVLEAQEGAAALELLRRENGRVSAILLDLIMPGMDGYTMLKELSRDAALSCIPVIVVSQLNKSESESKALELGARDFVGKPYDAAVLHKRLANMIELYESNKAIAFFEHDSLTGIFNKKAFYRRGELLLEQNPDTQYAVVATDVSRFKLVNDSFGTEQGDALLRFIAERLNASVTQKGGICARHSADHFVALLPWNDHGGAMTDKMLQKADAELRSYPLDMNILLKFGVYPMERERQVPFALICDRAILAAQSVKGQYESACAYYDDSVRLRLIKEQNITNVMKQALLQGQFQVYLQPKYQLSSGRLAGAEALVRWSCPGMGAMNPSEFIPLFERNGFITELDWYIWDKTCAEIAAWQREIGRTVPVSVNVSRRDIYQLDLPSVLTELIQKYDLCPEQLHLEITETSYTENAEQMIGVVNKLKQLGFVIEMDDFGSGYSSLNMLSELPIDILKLDMRFIQKQNDQNNSRNILSFIISLAKWMNLSVIAEGVETGEQAQLLRSMGCDCVQGNYFAKPLTAVEFRRKLAKAELADVRQQGKICDL